MRAYLRTLYLRVDQYAIWHSNVVGGFVARPDATIAAIGVRHARSGSTGGAGRIFRIRLDQSVTNRRSPHPSDAPQLGVIHDQRAGVSIDQKSTVKDVLEVEMLGSVNVERIECLGALCEIDRDARYDSI